MGYRLIVAVFSLLLVTSCAAFDKDSDAVEGFGPGKDRQGMPTIGKEMGPQSGYYAGTMTLDSNSCESISDEVGVESRLGVDVVQDENIINATLDGEEAPMVGTLTGTNVVLSGKLMNVEHVYYFTFGDGVVTGSAEVIEADEAGEFGDPCASYTLDLQKGEKPAAEDGEAAPAEGEEEELQPKK